MTWITIEGAENTGKSLQTFSLGAHLEQAGHQVFLTKEPGSPHDPVCGMIRQLLLNPEHKIADRAALFLFLADRAQHIELIRSKLEEGCVVISDRSSLSTYVYHIAATQENDIELGLGALIDYAQQIPPDLCVVCNADYDWSMDGLRKRKSLDRIEQFDLDFHRRTHHLFSAGTIERIAREMQMAPQKIVFAPPASANEPADISDWIVGQFNGLR